MSETGGPSIEWTHDQLEEALEEIRHGSLKRGIDMVETTRDQLGEELTDDQDTDTETTEE